MPTGTVFGKYLLVKLLARGGMGEIYVAKQQGLAGYSKTVALKVVQAHLTEDSSFVQGFLGEAALSARMTHRNIVQVFDFGLDEETGSYFLAMEYVAGKPLNVILKQCAAAREQLPLALVKDVALQMCEGMSYAHNLTDDGGQPLRLVHRDLNPSNLLVSYAGDVKIIDFGIAKSEMSQVKTEAGMIKGKYVYMSPEQSMAQPLDRRSDIFAAGITVYEMLTGENPFHKSNVMLSLEAVQKLDPPLPSEFDAAFAPFDPICARALAKDREQRYQDCADMAEDLKRVVVPPPGERLGPFVGRLFRSALQEEQQLMQEVAAAVPSRPSAAEHPSAPPPAPHPPSPQPDPLRESPRRTSIPPPSKPRTPALDSTAIIDARTGELAPPSNRSAPPPEPRPRGPAPSADSTAILDSRTGELAPPAAARSAPEPRPRGPVLSPDGTAVLDSRTGEPAPPAGRREPQAAAEPLFRGVGDLVSTRRQRATLGIGIAIGCVVSFLGMGAFRMLGGEGERKAPPPAAPPTVIVVAPPEPAAPAPSAASREPAVPPETKAPSERVARPPAAPPKKTADAERPAPRETPPRQTETPPGEPPARAAAGAVLVRVTPALPILVAGRPVKPGLVPLPGNSAMFAVGDESAPMRLRARYEISDEGLVLRNLTTDPWSIVMAEGMPPRKVPVESLELAPGKMTQLRFKGPAGEVVLTLAFRKTAPTP